MFNSITLSNVVLSEAKNLYDYLRNPHCTGVQRKCRSAQGDIYEMIFYNIIRKWLYNWQVKVISRKSFDEERG